MVLKLSINTRRSGICKDCGKNYTFSLGQLYLPLLRRSEQPKPTIKDWLDSHDSQCLKCNPIPQEYQKQCGVILHREY